MLCLNSMLLLKVALRQVLRSRHVILIVNQLTRTEQIRLPGGRMKLSLQNDSSRHR